MPQHKFHKVLLVTDYDDTFYSQKFEIPKRNRDAVDYWLSQGGSFTFATGRAYETFLPQIGRENLRFNAPAVLSNGASIYDFQQNQLLWQSYLPEQAGLHIRTLLDLFPELGFESYHEGRVYVYHPNIVTLTHLERVSAPYTVCEKVSDMPMPWIKILIEQDHPMLLEIQSVILQRWGNLYEAIFSNPYLLEITAKGSNKGGTVQKVAQMLGIPPEHVYCIGDNQNDLPMLQISAIPFAPENCAQEVRDWGARIVGHCNQGSLADVVDILDHKYGTKGLCCT